MPHPDLAIKSRHGGGHGGGGISLHQHEIRSFSVQDALQRGQNPRRGLRQRLARRHDVQIVMRPYLESFQNLVEHGAMLRRHADLYVEAIVPGQAMVHRTEFDGLRPGTENHQHPNHRVPLSHNGR